VQGLRRGVAQLLRLQRNNRLHGPQCRRILVLVPQPETEASIGHILGMKWANALTSDHASAAKGKASIPDGLPRLTRSGRMAIACLGLLACLGPHCAAAQSFNWPAFGPHREVLRLEGITDTLPDFVGPIDGSAELTIFTEGNHYPVLLPLVLDTFPAWCETTGSCRVDPRKILIVTLPQPMIVRILLEGGVRLGDVVVPVGRNERVFPTFVMAGAEPLRQLAMTGMVEAQATVFARHRGMGLLMRRGLTDVDDLKSFSSRVRRLVIATESEPGARNQYRESLDAILGKKATFQLQSREVRTFPGRLGKRHRDVPYAILNGLADGGIIFSHLAAFYAQSYPDRLRFIAVPDAERFGQEIAILRTSGEHGPLAEAFGKFFLDAARSAYPAAGFTASDKFEYGKILQLAGR
jgi:hypothetical protein